MGPHPRRGQPDRRRVHHRLYLTDTAGNVAAAVTSAFTMDTVAPTATAISAANKAGGTATQMETRRHRHLHDQRSAGACVRPAGWSGASTNVVVRGTGGATDTLTVYDATNTTQVALAR